MKKYFFYIVILLFLLLGCKEEKKSNKVDLEQLDIDNSNNYQYIFKDRIEKDKQRENKYKKDDF